MDMLRPPPPYAPELATLTARPDFSSSRSHIFHSVIPHSDSARDGNTDHSGVRDDDGSCLGKISQNADTTTGTMTARVQAQPNSAEQDTKAEAE